MSQFDQFADVSVWADGRTVPLRDALDTAPTDLLHPLWGVVAAWDAERGKHIVNWDLGWVLVDRADEDWPRRQLLFELAACEPLDLDLIAGAIEAFGALDRDDLCRERGGRVRPGADDRWVAEHGPVHGSVAVGTASSPESALALLTQSCEAARADLRAALHRSGDALLRRVAAAPWWCPRYEVWSTTMRAGSAHRWRAATAERDAASRRHPEWARLDRELARAAAGSDPIPT